VLRLYLRHYDEKPVIRSLARVSRPGRRIYKGATQLRPVRNGLGNATVSTSKGLMTAKQARQQRIGGEAMALVWWGAACHAVERSRSRFRPAGRSRSTAAPSR